MPDTDLRLPIDANNTTELNQFLGGLFLASLVAQFNTMLADAYSAATEMGRKPTEDQERRLREVVAGEAFDKVATYFPEPIRSRLIEQREHFVTGVFGLN